MAILLILLIMEIIMEF